MINRPMKRTAVAKLVLRYLGVGVALLLMLLGSQRPAFKLASATGDGPMIAGPVQAADDCRPCLEEQDRLLRSITTDCVQAPGGAPTLTAEDVLRIVRDAARAVNDSRLVIAVTDRAGRILAVFRKPNAPRRVVAEFGRLVEANDLAVALARTGAFFSNDQAPLSSRTVRFISGIHFPPGIAFTPNAALYGIENTNRGCDFGGPDEMIFNPGKIVPRARSLRGVMDNLPCNGANQAGCGHGIATGKATVSDDIPYPHALDPGGFPLFKAGRVVGGIGVVIGNDGHSRTPNEYAAAELAAFTAACPGLASVLPLPPPGVIFLDGIRLPFAKINGVELPPVPDEFTCPTPSASRFSGDFPQPLEGEFLSGFEPVAGGVVCDGWLIGPRGSAPGIIPQLTQPEVERIVRQAAEAACRTRAAIRLPSNSAAKMVIAVGDVEGNILGVFRMPDATAFSIDVAVAKARNVVYFSRAPRPADFPVPPFTERAVAVTNRTISFGSQPLFPPGIGPGAGPFDPASAGPFFRSLYLFDLDHPCSQGSDPGPASGQPDNRSGIIFFPGSAPLYRDGQLVGGLGISGDGVEQDDVVTDLGARGFEAPPEIRADQIILPTPRGPVRLPYLKFNRNPERGCQGSEANR